MRGFCAKKSQMCHVFFSLGLIFAVLELYGRTSQIFRISRSQLSRLTWCATQLIVFMWCLLILVFVGKCQRWGWPERLQNQWTVPMDDVFGVILTVQDSSETMLSDLARCVFPQVNPMVDPIHSGTLLMEVSWHEITPSFHPFLDRIFPEINQAFLIAPLMETPINRESVARGELHPSSSGSCQDFMTD